MERKYKPRFITNKTDSNILMTQIRAENKKFTHKEQPFFLNSHRQPLEGAGKKVFKENLYQTTCLNLSRSQSPHSSSIKTGKRTGYHCGGEKDRSVGKRKFLKEIYKQHNRNILSPKPEKPKSPHHSGRRRFDQSPTNQNRISPGFTLKLNNCDN